MAKTLETALHGYFNMKGSFLYSAYRCAAAASFRAAAAASEALPPTAHAPHTLTYRAPATTADLTIRYNQAIFYGDEFTTIVNGDFLMVLASMFFVFFYICIHTGSFPLGCFAILQIMLSIPLALFVYVPILRIPYFAQVHNLAIFICLGVGATASSSSSTHGGSRATSVDEDLGQRMERTVIPTSRGITLSTTFLAFPLHHLPSPPYLPPLAFLAAQVHLLPHIRHCAQHVRHDLPGVRRDRFRPDHAHCLVWRLRRVCDHLQLGFDGHVVRQSTARRPSITQTDASLSLSLSLTRLCCLCAAAVVV